LPIHLFFSCAQRPATTDGRGFCHGWTMFLLLAAGLFYEFLFAFTDIKKLFDMFFFHTFTIDFYCKIAFCLSAFVP
jgi:hypothetical protein